MTRFALKTDPMATDPGRWGHSLGNLGELVLPCLEAAAPKSVLEVGAYAGDMTRLLVEWADGREIRIWSVDPDPQPALVELARAHDQVELVRRTSLEAIPELPPAEVVVLDGDHNYFTVNRELALIEQRAAGGPLPLVICHDVGWPHARRDSYYAPETIPPDQRQPMVEGGYVFPGSEGLREGGLVYRWPATTEGGPRNGVLTAIEDFLDGRTGLRFVVVPAFFGLGVIWSEDAPYDRGLAAILDPWDRHPMLARLEANRVLHLASRELEAAKASWCQEREVAKDALLRKLLVSKTFTLAIWLSRLRQGGEPAFSKAEVSALLDRRPRDAAQAPGASS